MDEVTLVQVISSGGTFPVSIAVHGSLLYVLNARDGGSADGTAFYASNAGSGTLSGYSDDGSGTLQAAGTTAAGPGTVDAAVSGDGRYLYVQAGAAGAVDEFRVTPGGSLASVGSVTVPGAIGGAGIAAS